MEVQAKRCIIENLASGPEDRALTRALSASAAPILSGAAAAAAGVVGNATVAGLSLLSRAYRGQADNETRSGSPAAHVPILAPHAEESDVRCQATVIPNDQTAAYESHDFQHVGFPAGVCLACCNFC